jgi:hypothetical protein
MAMLRKATILLPALLAATLSGCAGYRQYEVKDADLIQVSYDAVAELNSRLNRKIPKNNLIVVSTLLNVDNLNKTSAFGRIVSDQIASAFHKDGHQIVGMELPIDLFIMKEDGTLQLTPETKKELKRYQAGVLVGGVYAPGKKNTYVSLRIVDLATKTVISSADFSVPMGPDAKFLTASKEVGSTASTEATAEPQQEQAAEETEKPVETKPAKTGIE